MRAKESPLHLYRVESDSPYARYFENGRSDTGLVKGAVPEDVFENNAGNESIYRKRSKADALELQCELVRMYFAHIHNTHHSLFHEPTVMSQVRNGDLPEVLLHAMMALGSR